MLNPYFDSLLLIFCYMIIWFLIAQFKKDNGIADIAWGLGFVIIAIWMAMFYNHSMSWIVTFFPTIWGLRLSAYIFIRNRGKAEDFRYQNFRKKWANRPKTGAFLQVFMLQGFLMFLISFPILQIKENLNDFGLLQYIGSIIFFFGFFWESIADYQLYKFKQNPQNKGKIMTSGLWAYSRHPNYFGEIVLWWGIYLLFIPFGPWYISVIGPIVITFLLTRVSGVPMLEQKYKDNEAYLAYIKKTNALIPTIT